MSRKDKQRALLAELRRTRITLQFATEKVEAALLKEVSLDLAHSTSKVLGLSRARVGGVAQHKCNCGRLATAYEKQFWESIEHLLTLKHSDWDDYKGPPSPRELEAIKNRFALNVARLCAKSLTDLWLHQGV